MTERDTSHLRLVVDGTSKNDIQKNTVPRGERQLAFPYPETSTVLFLQVATIGRDQFSKLINDYTPRWVFDIRAVPRLDTLATSRRSAFSLFERSKASYIDLFGRINVTSYSVAEANPAFWAKVVLDLLRDSQRKGPYLFLFDNENLMATSAKIVPDIIKPAIGKEFRFADLSHANPIGKMDLD